MNHRTTLIKMLLALEKEMAVVMSQGAGYYTCAPFARRFNKLLGQTRELFPAGDSLMGTFEELAPKDPIDPGEKSKILLEIHIEINQLVTLLESAGEEDAR